MHSHHPPPGERHTLGRGQGRRGGSEHGQRRGAGVLLAPRQQLPSQPPPPQLLLVLDVHALLWVGNRSLLHDLLSVAAPATRAAAQRSCHPLCAPLALCPPRSPPPLTSLPAAAVVRHAAPPPASQEHHAVGASAVDSVARACARAAHPALRACASTGTTPPGAGLAARRRCNTCDRELAPAGHGRCVLSGAVGAHTCPPALWGCG